VIPVLLGYTLMKAEFWQSWCQLYVTSENSYGLTRGSPVTVSGMTVGHVQKVELVREGVVGVQFKIKKEYQPLIRRNTLARFQQKNIVVGDWTIALTGGTDDVPPVEEGDTLKSEAPIRLDKTITQVTSMVTLVETMLTGVLEGKGTVGRLLTEDSLVTMAHQISRSVDQLVQSTEVTLVNADTLINELTGLGRSGSGFIDSLNQISGQVRETIDKATAILENLEGASEDVAPLLGDVQEELGEVERMMRALQQSWIYRKITGESDDPILKGTP
jgi:phospholipid/cholesterol/gamma-HCH transport system substrate-binding protein